MYIGERVMDFAPNVCEMTPLCQFCVVIALFYHIISSIILWYSESS